MEKQKDITLYRKGSDGVMMTLSAPSTNNKIYISLCHYNDSIGKYDFHNRILMSLDIFEVGGFLDILLTRKEGLKFEAFHTQNKDGVKTITTAMMVFGERYHEFTFSLKQNKDGHPRECYIKLNRSEAATIRTILQSDIPRMRIPDYVPNK